MINYGLKKIIKGKNVMPNTNINLGKNELLELLDRNPPDLYSALSDALTDSDFKEVALNAATSKRKIIEKIKPMKAIELRDILIAVQPFLKPEPKLLVTQS